MTETVLIVDDHDGFRSFARRVLGRPPFEIVGEAADGQSCLDAVSSLQPRVVLLDIQLPDVDGFEVARRLRRLSSPPRVILTSSRSAIDYGPRLLETAAHGFVAKDELSTTTLAAALEAD